MKNHLLPSFFTFSVFNADNQDVTGDIIAKMPKEYGKSVLNWFKNQNKSVYIGHSGILGQKRVSMAFVFDNPVSDILLCEEKPVYTVRIEENMNNMPRKVYKNA